MVDVSLTDLCEFCDCVCMRFEFGQMPRVTMSVVEMMQGNT